MIRFVLVAALMAGTVLLTACAGADSGTKGKAAAKPPPLTLHQQIGQHFVFPFNGTKPPRALVRRIRRGEAAGVILFGRNVRSASQVKRMTARLQSIPRPKGMEAPLLVMVDQEGGDVRRLDGPPASPAAAMRTTAGEQGTATARFLRGAGVNVDLAPVVDIGRPGGSISDDRRAFGANAATVTKYAGAFSDALNRENVASALKHFPGFGSATANTDNTAVRINQTLADLRTSDLIPYSAIKTPIVLSSTAVYPKVDPAPASFSKRWITAELRDRIGFKGVVITDDLQTPAVSGYGTPSQLAYFALSAGVDMPLFAKNYGTAAKAAAGLTSAVRQGKLSRGYLDAGARRVLALRASL